mmetsp:Transcript_24852/g.62514  ORF Transcript_24852/g.62514 Transcript_24852/m.62514 type:complete len:252 (-) Transcript_24852:3273-4028(-)
MNLDAVKTPRKPTLTSLQGMDPRTTSKPEPNAFTLADEDLFRIRVEGAGVVIRCCYACVPQHEPFSLHIVRFLRLCRCCYCRRFFCCDFFFVRLWVECVRWLHCCCARTTFRSPAPDRNGRTVALVQGRLHHTPPRRPAEPHVLFLAAVRGRRRHSVLLNPQVHFFSGLWVVQHLLRFGIQQLFQLHLLVVNVALPRELGPVGSRLIRLQRGPTTSTSFQLLLLVPLPQPASRHDAVIAPLLQDALPLQSV